MANRLAQRPSEFLALAFLGKVLLYYILFQICAARLSIFEKRYPIEAFFFTLLNRHHLDAFIYLADLFLQSLFNLFNSRFWHLLHFLNPFVLGLYTGKHLEIPFAFGMISLKIRMIIYQKVDFRVKKIGPKARGRDVRIASTHLEMALISHF
jgi:hypothetical protein